jgi:hypothetical protein
MDVHKAVLFFSAAGQTLAKREKAAACHIVIECDFDAAIGTLIGPGLRSTLCRACRWRPEQSADVGLRQTYHLHRRRAGLCGCGCSRRK